MTATTANEFNAAAEASAKSEKEGMSTWGCTWRVGGALILFTCGVIAVCYGSQFAIGYVAGMGLSALATTIISYAITGVAYLAASLSGWYTGEYCTRTMAAREAAKCAEAAAA